MMSGAGGLASMLGGMGGSGGGHSGSGLASLFSGLFGNSGGPYKDAMKQYEKYGQKGQDAINPFAQAGQGAIAPFQQWLQSQKDPSQFINHLMSQYQESPFAQNQQQQGIRASNNLGSATGLTGSTPLQMQAQQNAQNISSADQNGWLQNVLGINSNYGNGQMHMMDQGQGAANQLMQLFQNMGMQMGEGAYGKKAGQQNDMNNTMGGLFQMLGGGLFS
jgi:hypothetical protein